MNSLEQAVKRYKAKLRQSRPRDAQRARAYNWENDLFTGQPELKPRQLRDLLARVWKFAGFHPATVPELLFSRSTRRSFALSTYQISLARPHRQTVILLHEVSHCIVSARRSAPVESHGPEWLAVYIRLLERFGRTGLAGLRASAKSYGLRVASGEVAERVYLKSPALEAGRQKRAATRERLRALTEAEAEREYENAALRAEAAGQ